VGVRLRAVNVPMYKRQLEKACRTRLDDVLLDEGLTERTSVEDAQAESELTGRHLSQILFERDLLDEYDLAKLVSQHYSLPYVDLQEYEIPPAALAQVPVAFCREHSLIPIEQFGSYTAVAVCQMPPIEVLRQLHSLLHGTPFVYVALNREILAVIESMDESVYVPRDSADGEAVPAAPGESTEFTGFVSSVDPELPPIVMRLGYSMHTRESSALPRQSLQGLTARPMAASDSQAAPAVPVSTEPGDEGKGPAAWQEIFDLGDEAP